MPPREPTTAIAPGSTGAALKWGSTTVRGSTGLAAAGRHAGSAGCTRRLRTSGEDPGHGRSRRAERTTNPVERRTERRHRQPHRQFRRISSPPLVRLASSQSRGRRSAPGHERVADVATLDHRCRRRHRTGVDANRTIRSPGPCITRGVLLARQRPNRRTIRANVVSSGQQRIAFRRSGGTRTVRPCDSPASTRTRISFSTRLRSRSVEDVSAGDAELLLEIREPAGAEERVSRTNQDRPGSPQARSRACGQFAQLGIVEVASGA